MSQLTLEGGPSLGTVEHILELAEQYGRIDDIADFRDWCERRGAFAGQSVDERLRRGDIWWIRERVFKTKVNGLRRMICLAQGGPWVSRALATKEEHGTFCRFLKERIRRDEEALQMELDYHSDRWGEAVVLEEGQKPDA